MKMVMVDDSRISNAGENQGHLLCLNCSWPSAGKMEMLRILLKAAIRFWSRAACYEDKQFDEKEIEVARALV